MQTIQPFRLTRRSMIAGVATAMPSARALAEQASDPKLERDATTALRRLTSTVPAARELSEKAAAILVFPKIVKAGFVIGGAYGQGTLRQNGVTVGYYRSTAASYGLQAGAQWFGYAMFFMNTAALKYLDQSGGFEIGVGPSIAVIDKGAARKLTSTTVTQDVYVFIFGQKGLMAGLGVEGSKITRL